MKKQLFLIGALFVLLFSGNVFARQTAIDGKVLSGTGAALSGATVKSGKLSVLTGNNG